MKKIFIISIILLLSYDLFAQQVNWTQMTNKGGIGIESASSFSIGNKGYIVGGFYGGRKKDFWQWDQTSNMWTQLADFEGDERNTAIGFSIDQKGYFGLGTKSSGVFLDDIWEWNPDSNSWNKNGNYNTTVGKRTVSVVFVIDNEAFIGLGVIGSDIVDDFWKWNPSSDSWEQLPDFPGGARRDATAFSIGNNGYVGLGYDNNSVLKDFWKWDNVLEEWSQLPDFAGDARDKATSFSLNGFGFVGLGFNGSKLLNDFWSFDPVNENWNQINDLPSDGRRNASAFVINNNGYVGVGVNIGNNVLSDLWELNILSGIQITNISHQEICAGDSLTVNITVYDSLEIGNEFYVLLSDSNGNFELADTIGFSSNINSLSINCFIPANISQSNNYQIKAVSTDPEYIDIFNSFLTIYELPEKPIITRDNNELITSASGNTFWFFNDNLISGENNNTYLAENVGKYQIKIENDFGCSMDSDPFTMNLVINSISNSEFCSGDSILVDITTLEIQDGNTFQILLSDQNGDFNSINVIGSIIGKDPGSIKGMIPYSLIESINYRLKITSSNPDNYYVSEKINILETPDVPVISLDDNKLVSSASTGNQWYLDGGFIPGATTQILIYTTNGSYTLEVTNSNGCSRSSDPFIIDNVNLESPNNFINSIQLYPNPVTDGSFSIHLNQDINFESYNINIINLSGKVVYSNNYIEKNTIHVRFETDVSGIYFVQIIGNIEYKDEVNIGYIKILITE